MSSTNAAHALTIRRAVPSDAPCLEALINAAFRDDDTTDVYLDADPDRRARVDLVSEASVLRSITDVPDLVVFVGVEPGTAAGEEEEIVGHFSLRRTTSSSPSTPAEAAAAAAAKSGSEEPQQTPVTTAAWFALLAVSPAHQGRGYGGQLLAHAESFARTEWDARRVEFGVVNTRSALRAWYERRGYRPTGGEKEFAYAMHPGWEGVLRGDMVFLDYAKDL
ncbi:acyl-CoA N-acyltransferase [Microdochium bolleyi]|uniref:Acyl-CoA N-acyltransferase n=1 Tax=Microdochium bolleyi TaxID=196109 RepID=A0A136IYX4_9PEZI|nr:acyl-CoA N-acyltransferase [Microdochium bolleyi]